MEGSDPYFISIIQDLYSASIFCNAEINPCMNKLELLQNHMCDTLNMPKFGVLCPEPTDAPLMHPDQKK